MERKTFLIKLINDKFEQTIETIIGILPSITEATNDITNFSIWKAEDMVFGYYEAAQDSTATDNLIRSFFEEKIGASSIILASPGNMRLMYSAIGLPREDKSTIRHRVFITRLKPGCSEEYKLRHDMLSSRMNNPANNSPTNNFTIWNAGDYICGYSEIDVDYTQPNTEEAKNATIVWEKKMLEIMDWLTDDVDYISGEKHVKIRCLLKV